MIFGTFQVSFICILILKSEFNVRIFYFSILLRILFFIAALYAFQDVFDKKN